ncbi:MAG: hypothetical protein OQK04_05615 [Kangiellaceae bacterium]|nr:hypothetical protein [Kangiellaceae bacterium]MCW8998172.1 hypothetical protein [Kangiellaceae bacterium]
MRWTQLDENIMKGEFNWKKIYAAPKSKIIDKNNDPKGVIATVVVLTIVGLIVNAMLALATIEKATPYGSNRLLYWLSIAIILPTIIFVTSYKLRKGVSARLRLNILFGFLMLEIVTQILILTDTIIVY